MKSLEITQIPVADIRTEKPFSHFFPIHDDTVLAIRIDMNANGFDPAFPIILWEKDNILVDGHTRLIAAKEAGMEHIPALVKPFESEDDAILYAFHLQRNRRNLSDEQIINCLEVLDKISSKKKNSPDSRKLNKKEIVKERAEELGTSQSKIEKARAILEYGDDHIKDQVQSGKTSINKAFKDVQDQRRESGELKGPKITALASDARYNKTLQNLSREISYIKDENWVQVSRDKVLADLEQLVSMIHQAP